MIWFWLGLILVLLSTALLFPTRRASLIGALRKWLEQNDPVLGSLASIVTIVGLPIVLLGGYLAYHQLGEVGQGVQAIKEQLLPITAVEVQFNTIDKNLASLDQYGLSVRNYQQSAWQRGGRSEYLKLTTEQGDHCWKEAGSKCGQERMPPKNIVVKELMTKQFRARTEIRGFNPNSNWQQAGLVVLDDDEYGSFVRLTVGYDTSQKECSGKEIRVQWVWQIRNVRMRPIQQCRPLQAFNGQPIKRILLEIIRQGDEFHFGYWSGEEQEGMTWMDPQRVPIGQRYVGLEAFQGVTSEDCAPRTQRPAVAEFASIQIGPL